MAIDVYFCEKCGLAFQVETPDENDNGRVAADSGSEEAVVSAPPCPRCEDLQTTRMYRMPAQTGGCSPSAGC